MGTRTRRGPGFTAPGHLRNSTDPSDEQPHGNTSGNRSQERGLGDRATQALRYGTTFGSDDSTSAALRSALLGMVNAGWSYDHIKTAVLDRTNAGGRKVQNLADVRGMARAIRHLDREYAQARAYVHRNGQILDANGALFAITEWRERVAATRWKGAGGITDQNTLDAIGRRAEALKSSTSIPMSARTLAEEVGVQFQTAARSLRRVVAAGWLKLVARSTGKHPALYALTIPTCEVGATSPHTELAREVSHLLHSLGPGHDAWRWKALGKGPQRVYALVLQNFGAAEIASQLGISRRAVYQHLGRLRAAELVDNSGNGVWTATEKTLAEVAVEYETDGAGDRQREAHQRQRDAHHAGQASPIRRRPPAIRRKGTGAGTARGTHSTGPLVPGRRDGFVG
jgi:DNA-binding transcriptional ArsR family regulator